MQPIDGEVIAELAYGHAAMLWRVNLGWRRRKEKNLWGFNLDLERVYWDKKEIADSEEGSDNPDISDRTQRVIPYVEDHRNCLIFQPHVALDVGQMASLQAALKNAIQIRYQLEDGELAAEPLPTEDTRTAILLYEAAEGGAGVLRRLVDDSTALASVAREALELAHRCVELTERRDPYCLHTLAVALAENQKFDEAITVARNAAILARQLAGQELIDHLNASLRGYQQKQAFRAPNW